MKKIDLALIGAGPIGLEYVKVLKKFSNNINLKCVLTKSNIRFKKIKKFFPNISRETSIKKIYNKFKPQLVIVAVNEIAIFKTYKEVLKYDWVSFLEKPFGLNLKEAQKIKKVLKIKNYSSTFVAYNRRNYNSVLLLKKKINKFRNSKNFFVIDNQSPKKLKKLGIHNNVIKNLHYVNSIHLIDLILFLTEGKIISISKIYKDKHFVFTRINFSSGDNVIYFCKWDLDGRMSLNVNFENQFLKLKPIEKLIGHKKKNLNKSKLKEGFYNQIRNLILYINGKKKVNLVNINEAMKSMSLINRIYGI